jgi:hypothetical protein
LVGVQQSPPESVGTIARHKDLGSLDGMVKNFAAELGPARINGVCAGVVATELRHRLPEPEWHVIRTAGKNHP